MATTGSTLANASTTNPFDISAPTPAVTPATPAAANLQSAVNSTSAPVATGYTASTAGTTNYDPTLAASSGYNAATAGTNVNTVGNDSTVQGQLGGILASGSPLMQQADTSANQAMNAKGLLNSSMAVGAGENAMIASAAVTLTFPVAEAP